MNHLRQFVFLLLGFCTFSAWAQCPVRTYTRPDNVCVGSPVAFGNLPASSRQFLFCSGDLAATPTSRTAITNSLLSSLVGIYPFTLGGQYYAMGLSRTSGNLIRFDFGSSYTNTPTVNNLGNFSGVIPAGGAFSFELFQTQAGQWVAAVGQLSSTLIVLDFGTSPLNTPTTRSFVLPGLSAVAGLAMSEEPDGFYLLAANNGTSILRYRFSDVLISTPTQIGSIVITGASLQGLRLVKECGITYLFASSSNSRLFRLNYGSALGSSTPTVTEITGVNGLNVPGSPDVFFSNNRWYLVVLNRTGGTLSRVDLGSRLADNQFTSLTAVILPFTGVIASTIGLSAFVGPEGNVQVWLNPGTTLAQVTFAAASTCTFNQSQVTSTGSPFQVTTSSPGFNYFFSRPLTAQWTRAEVLRDSVNIQPPATIQLSVGERQCVSDTLRFTQTAQPALQNISWDFGDGSSPSPSGKHLYATPGTYTVTVSGTDVVSNCPAQATLRVRVFPTTADRPSSTFTTTGRLCSGDSVQFQSTATWANGTIVRYFWDFGNGQTSTRRDPKAFFATPGNYTVRFTATDSSGCGNEGSQVITISPGANVRFDVLDQCEGQTTRFTDRTEFAPGTSAQSYLWDFGGGNTSTDVNPSFRFAGPGTYRVSVRVINNLGCEVNRVQDVIVYPTPRASARYSPFTFVGQAVSFQNASLAPQQTITDWSWDFGDPASGANNTSTLPSPQHIFATPGAYTVRLRITTQQGCTDDTTFALNLVYTCPTASLVAPATGALNTPIEVTNASTPQPDGNRWAWDFCGGDLLNNPLIRTLVLPYENLRVVEMANDSGNFVAFTTYASESASRPQLLRLNFGSSPDNVPTQSLFVNPGGLLVGTYNIRLYKQDTTWYGLATTFNASNNRLVRLNFGRTLRSADPPQAEQITLANNILNRPTGLQIVRDRDSIFAFVVNNTSATAGNLVRLGFGNSLANTPEVRAFTNLPNMGNSSNLVSITFLRQCNEWFAVGLTNLGIVYRFSFGPTLNNTPRVTDLTSVITGTLGISTQSLASAQSVTLEYENGDPYLFITAQSGPSGTNTTLIRVRFASLAQNPVEAFNLGNLGSLNGVFSFRIVRDGTETWALATNSTFSSTRSLLYVLKYSQPCGANPAFVAENTTSAFKNVQFAQSGSYNLNLTVEDNRGWRSQTSRAIAIAAGVSQPETCPGVLLAVSNDSICPGAVVPVAATVNTPPGSQVYFDACAGDLRQNPTIAGASPVTVSTSTIQGMEVVLDGANWFAFVTNSTDNSVTRLNFGNSLENTFTTSVLNGVSEDLRGPRDIKIVKADDGNWYGVVANNTNSTISLLNFGPSLTNNDPRTYSLSAGNLLQRPVGLEIVRDRGSLYVLVVNSSPAALTVFRFGGTLATTPVVSFLPLAGIASPDRLSLVKDCTTWVGAVNDPSNGNVHHLAFTNGLEAVPVITRVAVTPLQGQNQPFPSNRSVLITQEGGQFYLLVSSELTSGIVLRVRLGSNGVVPSFGGLENAGRFGADALTGTLCMLHRRASGSRNYLITSSNLAALRTINIFRFPNSCPTNTAEFAVATPTNLSYSARGRYYQMLEVTSPAGHVTRSVDSVGIRDVIIPDVRVTANTRCQGDLTNFFIANPVLGTQYEWNFGTLADTLANQGTGTAINFQFPRAGTYIVRVLARAGGCEVRQRLEVIIRSKPIPAWVASQSTYCTFDSIAITNTSLLGGGAVAQSIWELADINGAIITRDNRYTPKFSLPTAGQYLLRLRLRMVSGCDTTSAYDTLEVVPGGQQPALLVLSSCTQDSTEFRLTSSLLPGTSILWRLADGRTFSGVSNFKAFFTVPGPNSVTLTLSLGTCISSVTQNFVVNPRPGGTIVSSGVRCTDNPVTFSISNPNDIASYRWESPFAISTLPTPAFAFPYVDTFKVYVTLTSPAGCTRRDSILVPVDTAPTAAFQFAPAGVCVGTQVTFTDLSTSNGILSSGGALDYFWEFGPDATDAMGAAKPTHTNANPPRIIFTRPGLVNVRLTVRALGRPNVLVIPITVNPLPEVRVVVREGCVNTPFELVDSSRVGGVPITNPNNEWIVNNIRFTNQRSVRALLAPSTQPYPYTLRVFGPGGCESSISGNLVVPESAQARFSLRDGNLAAPPFTVRTRNTSTNALRYEWDFGVPGAPGNLSTATEPTFEYTTAGVYRIRMRAYRSDLCFDSTSVTVNIVPEVNRDLAITQTSLAKNGSRLVLGAEIENRSNIEITTFTLQAEVGSLTGLNETWTGSLLPGAKMTYAFQSAINTGLGQSVDIVCLSALLPEGQTDINPADNRACASNAGALAVLDLYPNPSNQGEVQLTLATVIDDELVVELTDMLGRTVQTLYKNRESAGVKQFRISTRNLAQALYLVRVRSGNAIINKRLMVE